MITIYNTLNDKLVRMDQSEYDALSPEEVRDLGPEWIDEPDTEMRILPKPISVTMDYVTVPIHDDGLVCIGWRRSDRKIREEISVAYLILEEMQTQGEDYLYSDDDRWNLIGLDSKDIEKYIVEIRKHNEKNGYKYK